jgi:hypothetical protein
MGIQVQKTRSRDARKDDVPDQPLEKRHEKLADDLDDLLDEVDAILAENMEHLENYTQLSGE